MQTIRSIYDVNNLEKEIARHRMSGRFFMYRGQSDASWPILTTFYREFGNRLNINDCWKEYIEEYNIKKHKIISNNILAFKPAIENEDFFILTTLRHLGFPCHLIDWSARLRTAILFACCENYDIDGSLWILSTNMRLNNSPIAYSPFDIKKPELICKEFDLVPTDKCISDFLLGRIRRFRQNGFISIIPYSYVCDDFKSLLDDKYSLKKIIIPASSKHEIFNSLDGENSTFDYIMANNSEIDSLLQI